MILSAVLTPSPERSFANTEAFWSAHQEASSHLQLPIDRAISGGALADRLGYAFAAGYAAALQSLFPSLSPGTLASLAATEEGGAHPKAIRTQLSNGRLSGHKRWVTLAGSELFVLASAGTDADGRARLVVVRIPRDRQGVRVTPLGELPFIPEIAHAEVDFDQVPVAEAEVLPGDGWERWVKPFRTVEDLHVHAAALAYLGVMTARANGAHSLRERIAAELIALRGLAVEDPSSPLTHIALAGVLTQSRALVDEGESLWSSPSITTEARERWTRDRPLLEVAGKARAARIAKAWERLGR